NDVDADALLFDGLGSGLELLTEAASLLAPSSVAWAVTVAVTVPPAATLPIKNVTVPPELGYVPWPEVAATYFEMPGSGWVRVTPVAEAGPAFVTVIVYVTVPPSLAVLGPETPTERSALGLVFTIVPLTVAELLAVLESGLVAWTEAVSEKLAPLARLEGAK